MISKNLSSQLYLGLTLMLVNIPSWKEPVNILSTSNKQEKDLCIDGGK